uniref:Serine aminopeptidase S33 domain-containing protein n=1 Tax=Trieres chinensis TaxID=1514140 RepID=A0A7S1ZHD0_TRICV|mmetsp:Transcript_25642/g.52505  ORF Transcript_25642/g.52505 Transcript_25642/m.52505 type:complete len:296 (+) Transcript_25642:3-890(+)
MKYIGNTSMLVTGVAGFCGNAKFGEKASFLPRSDDNLAYLHVPGSSPGVLFLPGFQSSMRGSKSECIWEWCVSNGKEFTTFDYFCHGESVSGKDCCSRGTIGRWLDDTLAILDHVAESPSQVIVGSSMGGWLMVLAALERPERITGLVGVAPAPDFTLRLHENILSNDVLKAQFEECGFADVPTIYNAKGAYRIYRALLEEAEKHFLLSKAKEGGESPPMIKIKKTLPVRLIHGLKDADVRWECSLQLMEQLDSSDVELQLIKGGDHRLSSPQDLERMRRVIDELLCNWLKITTE